MNDPYKLQRFIAAQAATYDTAVAEPGELSGGMRQRVAVARALALEPRLPLMDEPFASLDQQTRRLMQRYLIRAWRQSEATVVLVSHDLEEALALADRIALMSRPGAHHRCSWPECASSPGCQEPRLREVREQLWRHLEAEVVLRELSGAELSVLDPLGEEVA
jgi:NitT/TauT family transport system ATP-binding protein